MSILIKDTEAYIGKALALKACHLYIDHEGRLTVIEKDREQLTDEHHQAEHQLDGRGLQVMPAFSDLHVHFREPGFEHKETLETGQIAAIRGGVTQVCTMPNTKPAIDRPERLQQYQNLIKKHPYIEVLPSVAITLDQNGTDITDLTQLTDLGAAAYTDDGRTVMSPAILEAALRTSAMTQKPVMTHSEDHEQADNYKTGPYPPEVESDIVARDIDILENCGGKLHIAHLSTAQSLEAVKRGKAKGLNLTCEVSPHHLYFDSEKLSFETAQYKVNPPLRNEANRQALIAGIKAGWVDAIASDHAPHEASSKSAAYQDGAYGFTGLETMFSAVNTVFDQAGIPMETLIHLMSLNPRTILGQPIDYIETGAQANLVCIDKDIKWTVTEADLHCKSKNSPWLGHTLKGRVIHLIRNQQLLLKGGNVNVG